MTDTEILDWLEKRERACPGSRNDNIFGDVTVSWGPIRLRERIVLGIAANKRRLAQQVTDKLDGTRTGQN